jgi:hypothetical protein
MKNILTSIILLSVLLLVPLATLHADIPQSFAELWADFDPRTAPLETEILNRPASSPRPVKPSVRGSRQKKLFLIRCSAWL